MKLNGKRLSVLREEVLVLPRKGTVNTEDGSENTEDIVFKFRPVASWDDFYTLCPAPKPPQGMVPGGLMKTVDDDPAYIVAMNQHSMLQRKWFVITSIGATDGLEFEKVKTGDPTTWGHFDKEMLESGLTPIELAKIYETAYRINTLNDEALEEAKKSFLASLRAPKVSG